MRTTHLRLRAIAPALVLTSTLLLAACGGTEPNVAAGPSTATAVASPVALAGIAPEHNAVDIAFIADMAPHHEGALTMSTLAETRASSPAVKALAAGIKSAQAPEISKMADMARAWGASAGAAGGGSMAMSMHDDEAALAPLSGAAFDKAFLTRMTVHHQSAVDMAERELAEGSNPQAKAMATAIVRGQTAQIAQMRVLLQNL